MFWLVKFWVHRIVFEAIKFWVHQIVFGSFPATIPVTGLLQRHRARNSLISQMSKQIKRTLSFWGPEELSVLQPEWSQELSNTTSGESVSEPCRHPVTYSFSSTTGQLNPSNLNISSPSAFKTPEKNKEVPKNKPFTKTLDSVMMSESLRDTIVQRRNALSEKLLCDDLSSLILDYAIEFGSEETTPMFVEL